MIAKQKDNRRREADNIARNGYICRYITAFRTARGPVQPPTQWIRGVLSLYVKLPRREAYNSPPSCAEVKECMDPYLISPSTPSWRGAHLKHRDNFTFTFYIMTITVAPRRLTTATGVEEMSLPSHLQHMD